MVLLVYVGASPSCNLLVFQLGQAAVGTTIPVRSWSLKVSLNPRCLFELIKQNHELFFVKDITNILQ